VKGANLMTAINLQLLKWDSRHAQALQTSKDALAALLQLSVPVGWPQFPEAFALPENEGEESKTAKTDWGGYFFIDAHNKVLVGSGGFYGQPDATGCVEIGYEIATEYWNRGYANQAVQKMVEFAFAHQQVETVMAHTLAEPNASNKVLKKIGMNFISEIDDLENGKIWRWQINRDEYHP
jgi:[ribosomal protein S5]-alanine N-acetyltransferase